MGLLRKQEADMKLNKERTGRGLIVKSRYQPSELKEKMNMVAENIKGVFVPSDVSWEGMNYSFYISHRQSLKDFISENSISKDDFLLFVKSVSELFDKAEQCGIDAHEFVFDYECVFVGESLASLEFIYAPDAETYKDGFVAYNRYSDMASLVSLYIEYNSLEKRGNHENEVAEILRILSEREKRPVSAGVSFPKEEILPFVVKDSMQLRISNYLKNKLHEAMDYFVVKGNTIKGATKMKLNGEMLLKGVKYTSNENSMQTVNIGRDYNWADIKVDTVYVSRKHAMIYKDNEKWYIRDLNSKNGTFVNGTRIASERPFSLNDGYEISFGLPESKLIFCLP